MLQSSLSKFASQFKPSSGGQGESVSTQNVASVHEESPSDQEDQSEGGVVNSEDDPADTQISTFNFCCLGSVILLKLCTTASSDQHNIGLKRHRNINNISYESSCRILSQ